MDFRKDLSHLGWGEVKRKQLQRASLADEWIQLVQMRRGSTVLDIGTGPGVFTLLYAQVVGDEGVIYAVDQSKEALLSLLDGVEGKLNNIVPFCKNAEDALDGIGTVEIVMLTDVLHHADTPAAIIQNAYQHIDESGYVLIAEFDSECEGLIGPPLVHRIPQEEVRNIVQSVGFQVVKEGKQDYEHYYLLLRK
ncbi:class I SAM-dependent methyltransferase [Paenibacillus turpanensis]|uniref:class I SAM-dependent methyltransferase n=1 Tax=Paenibacillus turpanensis TaxID=2689078 RepID=UPI00140B440C|nr:class I SAM-dependent methyltransferase [Paenibacillus turpanensis]